MKRVQHNTLWELQHGRHAQIFKFHAAQLERARKTMKLRSAKKVATDATMKKYGESRRDAQRALKHYRKLQARWVKALTDIAPLVHDGLEVVRSTADAIAEQVSRAELVAEFLSPEDVKRCADMPLDDVWPIALKRMRTLLQKDAGLRRLAEASGTTAYLSRRTR